MSIQFSLNSTVYVSRSSGEGLGGMPFSIRQDRQARVATEGFEPAVRAHTAVRRNELSSGAEFPLGASVWLNALHDRLMQQLRDMLPIGLNYFGGNGSGLQLMLPQRAPFGRSPFAPSQFAQRSHGLPDLQPKIAWPAPVRLFPQPEQSVPKPSPSKGETGRTADKREAAPDPANDKATAEPEKSEAKPSPSKGETGRTEGKREAAPDPANGKSATQPEKSEAKPSPSTDETGRTEGKREAAPTTGSGAATSGIDKQERANVETVEDILQRSNYGSSISNSDIDTLNGIYGDFRLTDKAIHRLNDYATTAAEEFLGDPAMIAHAQNWNSYSQAERREAAHDVWNVYSEILDLRDSVTFDTYSQPRNSDGFGVGGYYDTGSRTIKVNLHPDVNRNFAELTSLVLHEAVHARYERNLAHIPVNKAADEFRAGNISYEDFMFVANLRLYLDPEKVSEAKYQMNPHEQLAFTAEELYRDDLRLGGTHVKPRFSADHPLHQHLRDMHLIGPGSGIV